MGHHTRKGLSAWQLAMLALGTVVGGSFFLGSSVAIQAAGPSVLLSYIIGGILVYFILTALSEMTVANPVSGSFRSYAEQAFRKGAGFTVGWVYWTGLVLAMSSESTAVSILLKSWFPRLSLPLAGTAVIAGVTLVNLLGAEKLSRLESGLAAVKLLAIGGFIAAALWLAAGIGGGVSGHAGFEVLRSQTWMPGGIGGIAGSMLIVMFTYAGFEVLGLAASETAEPSRTIPKAIRLTVILLVGLYILAMASLFMLLPASAVGTQTSPFVSALSRFGLGWAGTLMNFVLVSAILSTMLASVFGLGRMLRSLAEEGHTPSWMRDHSDIPYRGILTSGAAMLAGLGLGLLLPENVYLFLVSSGGFALLFSYVMIMASHYRLRQRGLLPASANRFIGFPYTSVVSIIAMLAILASMPLVPGQGGGLAAGTAFVFFFAIIYVLKAKGARRSTFTSVRSAPPELRRSTDAPVTLGEIKLPAARLSKPASPVLARAEIAEELHPSGHEGEMEGERNEGTK